jgi:hypothetical protein
MCPAISLVCVDEMYLIGDENSGLVTASWSSDVSMTAASLVRRVDCNCRMEANPNVEDAPTAVALRATTDWSQI